MTEHRLKWWIICFASIHEGPKSAHVSVVRPACRRVARGGGSWRPAASGRATPTPKPTPTPMPQAAHQADSEFTRCDAAERALQTRELQKGFLRLRGRRLPGLLWRAWRIVLQGYWSEINRGKREGGWLMYRTGPLPAQAPAGCGQLAESRFGYHHSVRHTDMLGVGGAALRCSKPCDTWLCGCRHLP